MSLHVGEIMISIMSWVVCMFVFECVRVCVCMRVYLCVSVPVCACAEKGLSLHVSAASLVAVVRASCLHSLTRPAWPRLPNIIE